MALCNLKNFLVKVLIVIVIVFNLQDPCHISASPSPLFFDAIANFFKPSRQPSGSSSSYGAPKPISFRPVTVTISPNYNRPATGATKPFYNRPNNGLGGVGIPKLPRFKLPKFNFPSFGGKGKRPSGSASYGPPKKPSYGQNGSPGRPPRPIVPNVQNTSPTRRPSYRPQPVPSGPLPVYIPTQRPNIDHNQDAPYDLDHYLTMVDNVQGVQATPALHSQLQGQHSHFQGQRSHTVMHVLDRGIPFFLLITNRQPTQPHQRTSQPFQVMVKLFVNLNMGSHLEIQTEMEAHYQLIRRQQG